MTGKKIKEVCALYKKAVGTEYRSQRFIGFYPNLAQAFGHLRHCLEEIEHFVDAGRIEKAFRWLGFVQGVLWMLGKYSIDELAAHNRPAEEMPRRNCIPSPEAVAAMAPEEGSVSSSAIQPWQTVTFPAADADEGTNPKDLIGIKKPQLDLVPPALMLHVAEAMRDGAVKYGPFNWREKKVKARVYIGAALRHQFAFLDREDCAEDSGAHHLGHAGACLGIVLDAMECGTLHDDRPTPGPAAAIIKRLTRS